MAASFGIYGQYILGLKELGYDVWYLEDTGGPTYDPRSQSYGSDCSYGVAFLQESLRRLLPDSDLRWAFRDESGVLHGMSEEQLNRSVADADLLLNVSGGTLLRDAYMENRCKVLIDSDPGWNHFVNYPRWDESPGWQGTHGYRAHDFHFSYAERIGQPDCALPNLGIGWLPTRPPVCLDQWYAANAGDRWTTVMTWNNFRRPVVYNGKEYGTKELEFAKIEEIPALRPNGRFELAVGGSDPPKDKWQETGWHVVDAQSISTTADDYRQYIQASRGELSVAKNLYVAVHSGWFSCRSVCYLAAGRPVVVQDTGFSDFLPVGRGLHAFTTTAESLAAIDCVESDYRRQQSAARDVAAAYFDARDVLSQLLERAGLS